MSVNISPQQDLTIYWEEIRDRSLIFATIRDDTWNVLNMQHINQNSKRWNYSGFQVVEREKMKGPIRLVDTVV